MRMGFCYRLMLMLQRLEKLLAAKSKLVAIETQLLLGTTEAGNLTG